MADNFKRIKIGCFKFKNEAPPEFEYDRLYTIDEIIDNHRFTVVSDSGKVYQIRRKDVELFRPSFDPFQNVRNQKGEVFNICGYSISDEGNFYYEVINLSGETLHIKENGLVAEIHSWDKTKFQDEIWKANIEKRLFELEFIINGMRNV